MAFFFDRKSAAKQLCQEINPETQHPALILATSPDGLVLADELSHVLKISFELLISEDLNLRNSSCILGQLIEDAPPYIFEKFNLANPVLREVIEEKKKILMEKKIRYRANRNLDFSGLKDIFLVDDAFIYPKRFDAIIVFLRKFSNLKIHVCSPVIESSVLKKNESKFQFNYIKELSSALSIEEIYEKFSPLSDEEIQSILML